MINRIKGLFGMISTKVGLFFRYVKHTIVTILLALLLPGFVISKFFTIPFGIIAFFLTLILTSSDNLDTPLLSVIQFVSTGYIFTRDGIIVLIGSLAVGLLFPLALICLRQIINIFVSPLISSFMEMKKDVKMFKAHYEDNKDALKYGSKEEIIRAKKEAFKKNSNYIPRE